MAALARAYVRFGEQNAELYRLMFAFGLVPATAAGSPLAALSDQAFALLRHTLASRNPTEPQDWGAAHRAWAQLHGLVMLKAEGFIESALDTLLD